MANIAHGTFMAESSDLASTGLSGTHDILETVSGIEDGEQDMEDVPGARSTKGTITTLMVRNVPRQYMNEEMLEQEPR